MKGWCCASAARRVFFDLLCSRNLSRSWCLETPIRVSELRLVIVLAAHGALVPRYVFHVIDFSNLGFSEAVFPSGVLGQPSASRGSGPSLLGI